MTASFTPAIWIHVFAAVSALVLGVSPAEPLVLFTIAASLSLIAVVSCAGPIRRSLRVDPLIALREE